jgi:hypothetical protein
MADSAITQAANLIKGTEGYIPGVYRDPKGIATIGYGIALEREKNGVNQAQRRSGTLWEGRYRATVIDGEQYLLTCLRYVEMNPVRAGMVASPADYPWPSHRVHADGAPSSLVTPPSAIPGSRPDAGGPPGRLSRPVSE